jgi:ATPase subunit of ABC transporter with duplicated ATPase domains
MKENVCVIIQNISHQHLNGEILFKQISFSIQQYEKISIVGNNGIGKSTLLKIISGELEQTSGEVMSSSKPYYIPQHFGQCDKVTVADALRVKHKIHCLRKILSWRNST